MFGGGDQSHSHPMRFLCPPHESLQAEAICGCLKQRTGCHKLWLLVFLMFSCWIFLGGVGCNGYYITDITVCMNRQDRNRNLFFGNLGLNIRIRGRRGVIFFLTTGWCQPQHFGISWPHPPAWFWDCPGHEAPRWQAYSHTAPSHWRILGRTSTNP